MARTRSAHGGAKLIEKHSSRQWQIDQTRQRITEAALEMFQQHGFQSVTIEDIAKKAGIGRTTFYLHFQTKIDLANEIGLSISDVFGAHFRALGRVSPDSPEQARAWLRRMVVISQDHAVEVIIATQANVATPALGKDFIDVAEEWAFEALRGAGFDPDTVPLLAVETIRLIVISVDRFVYLRYHQLAEAPRSLDKAVAELITSSLGRALAIIAESPNVRPLAH